LESGRIGSAVARTHDESEMVSAMSEAAAEQTTRLLNALTAGDREAADQLMPLVYDQLRKIAGEYFRREPPGHTLQPTALVHEAYVKLVDQRHVHWRGRTHFLAVGAQLMRRILVDHARSKGRAKRGGGRLRITLDEAVAVSRGSDEDVLAVHEALEKLAKLDPRQARIVELRFFGGLTVQEVADALGVSKRTVESEWTMIRAWLRRELAEEVEP
jgi:RNA polymerase sigma-70 factor (ECF subfamily)